jgi:hypothetical protein
MQDGQRIDWFAIPDRFRAWRAMALWRKCLWIVSRTVTMALFYAFFAVGILWYNDPALVSGVLGGRESVMALLGLLSGRPELVVILLLLVPAVLVTVLLPHKPSWQR